MPIPPVGRTTSPTTFRPTVVPYIAPWTHERVPQLDMTARRGRLAYAGERPWDRDGRGVLWSRTPFLPGKGRPEYGQVHALRQRNAMERFLCQVCGHSADRNQDGTLWLLNHTVLEEVRAPGAPLLTSHPPICRSCAITAARACPHLRHSHVLLRVGHVQPAGVHGALYYPTTTGPRLLCATGVAYADERVHWVRAGQLLVHLNHYRPVPLTA